MPRLRRPEVVEVVESVPVELLSFADPAWQSAEATTGWLSAYGLDSPDSGWLDPVGRWLAAVRAWARLNEWTCRNVYKVVVTDWTRLRTAGVLSPGREVNRDRLRGSLCVSFAPRESLPVKRKVNRA